MLRMESRKSPLPMRLSLLGLLVASAGGCYAHAGYYSAGVSVSTLPRGHYEVYHGGRPYYYHDGRFYRHRGRRYIVVDAPVGIVVPRVPRGARSYRRGNVDYKEYRGVRYERDRRGRGFRVRGRARARWRR